jgi:hypothetical protein
MRACALSSELRLLFSGLSSSSVGARSRRRCQALRAPRRRNLAPASAPASASARRARGLPARAGETVGGRRGRLCTFAQRPRDHPRSWRCDGSEDRVPCCSWIASRGSASASAPDCNRARRRVKANDRPMISFAVRGRRAGRRARSTQAIDGRVSPPSARTSFSPWVRAHRRLGWRIRRDVVLPERRPVGRGRTPCGLATP